MNDDSMVAANGLRYVVFILSSDWGRDVAGLKAGLEAEGVICSELPAEELIPDERVSNAEVYFAPRLDGAVEMPPRFASAAGRAVNGRNAPRLDGAVVRTTVFLTDSPVIGEKLARLGLVYFGCVKEDAPSIERNAPRLDGADAWFEGAALVLEGFADIDARYLEEWLLRAQGLPVVIARTDRLLIREIAESDILELSRISRLDGEEKMRSISLRPVQNEYPQDVQHSCFDSDVFSEDRLHAYIQTAYRLQGYGLWSVLFQGKVIGCCGFAPWDGAETEIPEYPETEIWGINLSGISRPKGEDAPKLSLEMQYMLDMPFRRQGVGTEMCLAALEYARIRLGVEDVWARIRGDNDASKALAGKLGFHRYRSLFF